MWAHLLLVILLVTLANGSTPESSSCQRKPTVLSIRAGAYQHNGNSKRSSNRMLSRNRVLAEWQEIKTLGITLSSPFNNSISECGVRLSPCNHNANEWHFSFLGPENSPYAEGCYHGKIVLPIEYPQKAPKISMLTPSGRWEVGKDICLSVTSYHQETWNPNWGLRTLVMGLRLHMTSQAREIGAISASFADRRRLAQLSQSYTCGSCNCVHSQLLSKRAISCSSRAPAFLSSVDLTSNRTNSSNANDNVAADAARSGSHRSVNSYISIDSNCNSSRKKGLSSVARHKLRAVRICGKWLKRRIWRHGQNHTGSRNSSDNTKITSSRSSFKSTSNDNSNTNMQ